MAYQKKQYRRRRKSTLPSWLLVLLIIGGALLYINFQNQAAADPATNLEIPTLVSAAGDPWWSSDYAYRQQLDFDRPAGKLLEVKVDHSTLVLAGQSRPDASDLRVVAQIDDATELVPLIVSSPNTNSTLVTFDGSKYESAAYYLYYGNLRGDLPSTLPIPSTQMANGTKQATPGSIQTPTIKLTATKKWNLIKRDIAEVEISLHSEVGSVDENTQFYFATTGTDKLRAVEGLGIGNMEDYILQITGLNPGMKGLYFVIKSGGDTYRTNTVYFLLSRPVYVAWTIDWEGYNVQDWVLLAMNNIADKYQMPLTQFFNPRLYIDAQTPDYRRGEITDWLRSRLQNKGDEFSMHMHMQYDMIRAAGLEPVTSPRWGSGLDGYDVLTSDYDYTQFKQILSWGLQTFAEQGLPTPVGYRAGGWFADLDNLRAVADLGFAYDASGRESYVFGSKKQQGPWALTHTTQPYQPSTTNQNSSEPEPRLNLWEVPNNGNDSYWFGTDELISRFYANYTKPGEVMDAPKLITYLSHPDWFDVDQPKLEALFAEVGKYSFAGDNGPVVFTTISEALREWKD